MRLTHVGISGFRSIRKIDFAMDPVGVFVGGNAVGKTNLYRALQLVHCAATGTLALELAREGGLESVMWAGARRRNEAARIVLEVTLEAGAGEDDRRLASAYRLEIGHPDPVIDAAFDREALVKEETLTARVGRRSVALMERRGPTVWARDSNGARVRVEDGLLASETALASLRGGNFPEIEAVRHTLASWRFYHQFRSDAESPLRRPALALTSPMLDADGGNLAAVLATLRHIRGDTTDLDAAVGEAFPGARLVIERPSDAARFAMVFPELPHRHFRERELSDGTLQFLALQGALLSYRLPPLIALNEPEASLHPELLPALARSIGRAARRSQLWIVTHSRDLAGALEREVGIRAREVVRDDGATWLRGLNALGRFPDED